MKHVFTLTTILASIFIIAFCIQCKDRACSNSREGKMVIGVKLFDYNGDFNELFKELTSLGINTVFIVSEHLVTSKEFYEAAKKNNIAVFVVIQTFMNEAAVKKDSSLYAITHRGERAIEEWSHFVCPTRKDYRKQRIDYVKNIVQTYNPDGISIDFIRTFVFWENVYPGTDIVDMPNACFCPHCLEKFQAATGVTIPGELERTEDIARWILDNHGDVFTNWKCGVITSMVEEMTAAVKSVKSDIVINLHTVPWRKDDYNGAIRKIAGQDFKDLSGYTNYLSPMCYSNLLRLRPAWVDSVIHDMATDSRCGILPSIQMKEINPEKEGLFSVEDFESCLREALKPPSQGVVLFIWDWDAFSDAADRKELFKKVVTCRQ